MTISNGQPVDAAASNAAWISKSANDSKSGTLDLLAPSSGGDITNIQGALNTTMNAVGVTGFNDPNALIYDTNYVVADGEDRREAISALDSEFAGATGHTHTGTDGDGPKIGLVTAVTGILPEIFGGTNQNSYTAGDILYASTSNTLSKLPIGTDGYVLIASGGFPTWQTSQGGGGGGGLTWRTDDGISPIESIEYGYHVWKFEDGAGQTLRVRIKIPQNYQAGNQINMRVGLYSTSSSGTIFLNTTTYLIRANTDAIDSSANSHISTNSALTNTSSKQYRETVIDLTDVSGEINSVAVSPGDELQVILSRGSDTDTEDIRFMDDITEVMFS